MTEFEPIGRLERSVNQLIGEIERLPAEVLYRAPQPGEWPVMSNLAHVAEFLPYWAHAAEAIARQPGTVFGRTHGDPDRLGAVEQHGQDSLDVAVGRIRAGLQECLRVLKSLPAEAWANTGQHHARGPMTVAQLVEEFLVSHAEEHALQTHATLKSLASTKAKVD